MSVSFKGFIFFNFYWPCAMVYTYYSWPCITVAYLENSKLSLAGSPVVWHSESSVAFKFSFRMWSVTFCGLTLCALVCGYQHFR
jgi:hypothetical protein